jgi:hypothetical protein
MIERSHGELVAKQRSGVKNRGCEEKRAFVHEETVGKNMKRCEICQREDGGEQETTPSA